MFRCQSVSMSDVFVCVHSKYVSSCLRCKPHLSNDLGAEEDGFVTPWLAHVPLIPLALKSLAIRERAPLAKYPPISTHGSAQVFPLKPKTCLPKKGCPLPCFLGESFKQASLIT